MVVEWPVLFFHSFMMVIVLPPLCVGPVCMFSLCQASVLLQFIYLSHLIAHLKCVFPNLVLRCPQTVHIFAPGTGRKQKYGWSNRELGGIENVDLCGSMAQGMGWETIRKFAHRI